MSRYTHSGRASGCTTRQGSLRMLRAEIDRLQQAAVEKEHLQTALP
jgi:hypothetical protein